MDIKRYLTVDGFVVEDNFNQLWASREGSRWYPVRVPPKTVPCVFCCKGWEATGPAWLDQVELTQFGVAHESCYQQWLGLKDIDFFLELCGRHELDARALRPLRIGDQYFRERGRPWIEAHIGDDFQLKFGKRKRVWALHLMSRRIGERFPAGMVSTLRDKCGDETFIDNGNEVIVHCWNEDAVEDRVGFVLQTLSRA
jgi:hypothetical protein